SDFAPMGLQVLDPFAGSGSTGKAAIRKGVKFIGVELTDEYLPIIKGRLEHEINKKNGSAISVSLVPQPPWDRLAPKAYRSRTPKAPGHDRIERGGTAVSRRITLRFRSIHSKSIGRRKLKV
ncbi:MAG: hypothetical protein EBW39_06525, partial [Betaproteobacteria bacterium]|nr:hypothetical protein [Betaproteobacteria bacterium]